MWAGDGECICLVHRHSSDQSRPFIVQLPIAILGLGLVLWKLPEARPHGNELASKEATLSHKLSRVDFPGALTLVGTILTCLLALDMGAKGASKVITITSVSGFGVFLVSFILIEKYYAKEPILPLGLISKRNVLTSYLIIGFQAAGQFGVSHTSILRMLD